MTEIPKLEVGDYVLPTNLNAFQIVSPSLAAVAPYVYDDFILTDTTALPLRVRVVDYKDRGSDAYMLRPYIVAEQDVDEPGAPVVLDVQYVRLAHRPKFQIGDRVRTATSDENQKEGTVTAIRYCAYVVKFDDEVPEVRVEEALLEQIDDSGEVEPPIEPPTEPEGPMEPFSYSKYVVKRGQRTPRAMLYQAAANQLSQVLGNQAMHVGTVDGITGQAFTDSSTAVQTHYGITVDNVVGSGTWGKMTEDLGSWRPPLRWRIGEQQNTFENGGRQNAFGAWNIVSFEGWPNYGLWNCNCMDGNMAGSSIGMLLSMAGRKDLWQYDPSQPEIIADFLASKPGREAQLYDYMDRYVIQYAIDNLKIVGIDIGVVTAANLPETLESWNERILALCCDFSVNSGPVGMFSSRFPRIWDGEGLVKWDDTLPDRDACIAIYEEVYGIKVGNTNQQYNGTKYPRDKSREAMRRCVQEVASTQEEKINLIADLQARCIYARDLSGPETLQDLVLRRRRCVARLGGYTFQGTPYDTQKTFGVGI